MNNLDLECGGGRHSSTAMSHADHDDASVCFSEADEEGSCYSQFYSTAGGSIDYNFDSQIDQVLDSRRVSSVVSSDCSVDIGNRLREFKTLLEMMQGDCRICHLSLDQVDGSDLDSDIAIELGCSCKNDLAVAHQHCAETWFKIKGNKICEICQTIARNVIVSNDTESSQQLHEINVFSTNAVIVPPAAVQQLREINVYGTNAVRVPPAAVPSTSQSRSRAYLIGHWFVNSVLACIVTAFFLAWLFHFHMPS